jgi:hypothetical protein
LLRRENANRKDGQILFLTKSQGMPRAVIADTIEVVQRQYKDAELVLCEFISLQEYDIEE